MMTPAAGLVGAGLMGVVVVLRVVLFDVVVVFLVVVGTVINTPPGLKEEVRSVKSGAGLSTYTEVTLTGALVVVAFFVVVGIWTPGPAGH